MFGGKSPEEERLEFIDNCIAFDSPRLESEKYPESVVTVEDVAYMPGKNLDFYVPEDTMMDDYEEAFLLIHGGAFVYGMKELDKCYGMHLCEISGFPVINIDYTLLPNTTIDGILNDIMTAVDFIVERTGISKFHVTGDSAGGYLAVMTAICLNSEDVRDDLRLKLESEAMAVSMTPICGCYTLDKNFPGYYFENEDSMRLPSYMYNVCAAVKEIKPIPTAIVTGENDFLRADNNKFYKTLKDLGFNVTILDFEAKDGRDMHHVFPVSDPTWPESVEWINLVTKVAREAIITDGDD